MKKNPVNKTQCPTCGGDIPPHCKNHPEWYDKALTTIGVGANAADFIPAGTQLPTDTGYFFNCGAVVEDDTEYQIYKEIPVIAQFN